MDNVESDRNKPKEAYDAQVEKFSGSGGGIVADPKFDEALHANFNPGDKVDEPTQQTVSPAGKALTFTPGELQIGVDLKSSATLGEPKVIDMTMTKKIIGTEKGAMPGSVSGQTQSEYGKPSSKVSK